MRTSPETDSGWEVRVVAGPDAGLTATLPLGRTVVGGPRCRGGVAVADPQLAPFHLVLDVTAESVTVHAMVQSAMYVGVRPGAVAPGEPLAIGDTVLWVARVDPPVRPGDGSAEGVSPRLHHRPPRRRVPAPAGPPPPDADVPPDGSDTVMSPVPALLGAAVTASIAVVIGQPMFALLGLSGSAVALVTWGHAVLGRRRRRLSRLRANAERIRRRSVELTAYRAATVDHRRLDTPDLCRAVRRALDGDLRLWERRPLHDDVWTYVIGVGESFDDAWETIVRDVPIAVHLAPGTVTAIGGDLDRAREIVRSLLVQVLASVGPADVELDVVVDETADASAWSWLDRTPHRTVVGRSRAHGADDAVGVPPRHRIRVVDVASPSVMIPGADAIVVVLRDPSLVPASATAHGTVDACGRLRWHPDVASDLPVPVVAARCPIERAHRVVQALSGLQDPEDLTISLADGLPLVGLVPDDVATVTSTWAMAGDDPPPRTVLGRDAHGRPIELDLARDGPHAVVGGTTGSGKSELLRSLVVGLATCSPPWALSFLLVDFKGGAAFDACVDLPHVVGVLTDLDARATERALRSLNAELHRREQLLREAGASDLTGYRTSSASGRRDDIARLVIVVDEFATLAHDMPDVMQALVAVAQRGRSLGVHLVLATQRPAGTVTDDIRANTAIRIALRVASTSDALDVIGDAAPSTFPRDRPGRALIRLAADAPVLGQIASCSSTDDDGPDGGLPRLVGVVREAAHLMGGRAPHRPWPPALPRRAGPEDLLHPHDHGVLDDPDAQCRRPLRWLPSDGHLVVVGALGAGCSSTARTVVRQSIAARGDLEVQIIDGVGDRAWDELLEVAAVGSVVRLDETERLVRLVAHVADAVMGRRRASDERFGPLVLVVDGVGGVRRVLDDEGPDVVTAWDTVVADGPAVGVVILATGDHAGAVPLALMARATRRWVHRLADSVDASLLGATPRRLPVGAAPPGRVLCVPEMLDGQVLAPGGHAPPCPPTQRAPSIAVLPRHLDVSTLPSPEIVGDALHLPIGTGARDLRPVWARIDRGEHLVVVGPARSGRSSALAAFADAWTRASGRPALVFTGRRGGAWSDPDVVIADSVADLVARVDPTCWEVVVVDDADRVDDDAGRLERLVLAGTATVMVAVRPERLRGAFGHWTAAVRRSRTGLVLTGAGTADGGDLLGVVLPRRSATPPAPGRGWWVDDGVLRDLVQTPGERAARGAPPTGSDVQELTARTGANCASTRSA